MNNEYELQTISPKDPVTHPDVPDSPNPTEPEGVPDPPPVPDPFPVTDPPLTPDTEPIRDPEPGPHIPEPIPGGPPNVVF